MFSPFETEGLYTCIVIVTTILTGTYGHDQDAKLTAERSVLLSLRGLDDRRRPPLLLAPWILLRTLLYDPIINLEWKTLYDSYTIDTSKHHDFFVVTVSRLCYYCGISVRKYHVLDFLN